MNLRKILLLSIPPILSLMILDVFTSVPTIKMLLVGLVPIFISIIMWRTAYYKLKTAKHQHKIDSFLTINTLKHGYLWPKTLSQKEHPRGYLLNLFIWWLFALLGVVIFYYGIIASYQVHDSYLRVALPDSYNMNVASYFYRLLIPFLVINFYLYGFVYIYKTSKTTSAYIGFSLLWAGFTFLSLVLWIASRLH